jgi:PPOX class probable F420-dependent enzyme
MSQAEREEFLAGVHVGVLSVSAADGAAPLTVPVWYSYEPGGPVSLITGRRTRKAVAIEAAGRFSLCAQDERSPYKYVTVAGPAAIRGDATEDERRALARRYLGVTGGDAFVEAEPGAGNVVIRMTPERWLSNDYSKAGS